VFGYSAHITIIRFLFKKQDYVNASVQRSFRIEKLVSHWWNMNISKFLIFCFLKIVAKSEMVETIYIFKAEDRSMTVSVPLSDHGYKNTVFLTVGQVL